tara:strand:+ start:322 stop:576 length:255 start_codon:yes stop_codon:yes gene_type:complete
METENTWIVREITWGTKVHSDNTILRQECTHYEDKDKMFRDWRNREPPFNQWAMNIQTLVITSNKFVQFEAYVHWLENQGDEEE